MLRSIMIFDKFIQRMIKIETIRDWINKYPKKLFHYKSAEDIYNLVNNINFALDFTIYTAFFACGITGYEKGNGGIKLKMI